MGKTPRYEVRLTRCECGTHYWMFIKRDELIIGWATPRNMMEIVAAVAAIYVVWDIPYWTAVELVIAAGRQMKQIEIEHAPHVVIVIDDDFGPIRATREEVR